ncbi:MAG: formylglycine-generating enzyme family protein [Proteobacteria bacterium]|nr:formylglycine-generating enzyme family protein [Pseudomonadota bacterium]
MAKLSVGSIVQECADCPALVIVPSGQFTMGADGGEAGRPEGPRRAVTIPRAFAVGRFEVTHAQYAAFVEATQHDSGPGCAGWSAAKHNFEMLPDFNWRNPAAAVVTAADEPVVCVSWLDAKAYVAWLSELTGQRYRLATEAEWEYVARAASTTDFPWGDDEEQGCQYANVYDASSADPTKKFPAAKCTDKHSTVAPVGQYPPNAFGLYDVIGNVWEWTQDCYQGPYAAEPVDGSAYEVQGQCELRAVRGGSWRSHMFRQRPAWRGRDPETRKSDIFGFRVVRDLN